MKKTTMVKKIIGKVLEPLGFYYKKGNSAWYYVREKKDIFQTIVINDFYKENLRISFMTDAYGQDGIYEKDLISAEEYKGGGWGEHTYKTEDEFKQIIEYYLELIVKYGLDALEKISVPTTDVRPKPETDLYLYENHSMLAKEYNKKLQIEIANEIRIPKNLRMLTKEIYNLQNQKFEDVEYILIGYAALYGEIITTYYGGEWVYRDKKCFIDNIGISLNLVYPLNKIIYLWHGGREGVSDNDLYNKFQYSGS